MVLINSKGYFQGQKGSIWTIAIYLGQYLIYDISVDLVTFDLGLSLKVKSRSQTFQRLYLINCASYDQSLYEMHIVIHIYGLSVYLMTFDL